MNIIRGKARNPQRTVITGQPGVGKTTWACGSGSALVLSFEDGVEHIGAARVDCKPMDWTESLKTVREACTIAGDWNVVVIDTLDVLEKKCVDQVCKDGGKKGAVKNIAELGYDGNNTLLPAKWRELTWTLEMAKPKGRQVILVSHVKRAKIKDPTLTDEYHCFTGQLEEKVWQWTFNWADNVLFAAYDQATTGGRAIMLSGNRVLRCTKDTGYEAKNRLGLPDTLPLDWSAYARYLRTPEEVRAAIASLTTALAGNGDAEVTAKAAPYVLQAGDDVSKLCGIETALLAKQGSKS